MRDALFTRYDVFDPFTGLTYVVVRGSLLARFVTRGSFRRVHSRGRFYGCDFAPLEG